MTNGFYLQNFLYLYSRNKHVIMENTRIKLSETVMVIDAAYLNFVINDLKSILNRCWAVLYRGLTWHYLPCVWQWMPG